MSKTKGVTWVTLGPDPHFATCQRCGQMEPMPDLPMPLDAFTPFVEYVKARHQRCQPGEQLSLGAKSQ